MPLLHPGDTFPQLTLNIPGAQAIQVPGWFAGQFGVVLFNRGAWCPYCTAQLRAFQRAVDGRAGDGERAHTDSAPACALTRGHDLCRVRTGDKRVLASEFLCSQGGAFVPGKRRDPRGLSAPARCTRSSEMPLLEATG